MVVLALFLFYGTVLQCKSWSLMFQHCIQVAVTLAGDSQVKTAPTLSSVIPPGVVSVSKQRFNWTQTSQAASCWPSDTSDHTWWCWGRLPDSVRHVGFVIFFVTDPLLICLRGELTHDGRTELKSIIRDPFIDLFCGEDSLKERYFGV